MRNDTYIEKVAIFKFSALPWNKIIVSRRIKNKLNTERACSGSVHRYWSFKWRGVSGDRRIFPFHYS
jgi:hypothetical protein